jgi:CheY-like chemotaxis protein
MDSMQAERTTYELSSHPSGSLLVVDDNSVNRIMLSRYLTRLGLCPRTAIETTGAAITHRN